MVTRKERGRRTEHLIAAHLRPLFPHCRAVNSGAPGADLEETPGIAFEIKARARLDLPAWLRQTSRNAGQQLPILIIRPNGMGEASVGQWAAVVTLDHLTQLLREAGYGDNPTALGDGQGGLR